MIVRLSHRQRLPPSSSRAAKLIGRQQSVHRSRAESFQVERNELKPELLEDRGELGCDRGSQGAIQFVFCDFDAHNVSVMSYAKLPKPKSADRIFPAFHHIERLPCNRPAVLDAGRKASRRGLVPDAQSGFAGQFADFLFAESNPQQWGGNVMLVCRLLPWPEISLVIQVHTIRNRIEPASLAQRFHYRKQLI